MGDPEKSVASLEWSAWTAYAVATSLMAAILLTAGGIAMFVTFSTYSRFSLSELSGLLIVPVACMGSCVLANVAVGGSGWRYPVFAMVAGIQSVIAFLLVAPAVDLGNVAQFGLLAASTAAAVTLGIRIRHRNNRAGLWLVALLIMTALGSCALAYGLDSERRTYDISVPGDPRDVFGNVIPWGPNGMASMMVYFWVGATFPVGAAIPIALQHRRHTSPV